MSNSFRPNSSKSRAQRPPANAPKDPSPPRAGLAARRLAVTLLHLVLERGRSLDQAWAKIALSPEFSTLEVRDRALVRALVATTLRREGELETLLSRFLEKPLPVERGQLRSILLMGAAQLVCLDMPAHAVVDLSVELVRRDHGARRFDKLTNAVLRRVSEQGKGIIAELDGVRLNVPQWLYGRWEAHYGAARARSIAVACLREAPVDISLMPQVAAEAPRWAEKLGGRLLGTGTIRIAEAGRIEDLPGYADGLWWVQDAAAALVARAAGDVAGLAVADLCAAPGGKTAELASRGAKVTAVDASGQRLKRLAENMQRLRLAVDVVVADVANWQPDVLFDLVLLDAPCSATGTIRRHPDLMRQKKPEDIARLAQLQARLLAAAAGLVRPGGLLLYSTCSLEPEEGSAQVAAFLAGSDAFSREPIDANALGADKAWFTADGDIRTLPDGLPLDPPQLSGLDGFYVARLRRRG